MSPPSPTAEQKLIDMESRLKLMEKQLPASSTLEENLCSATKFMKLICFIEGIMFIVSTLIFFVIFMNYLDHGPEALNNWARNFMDTYVILLSVRWIPAFIDYANLLCEADLPALVDAGVRTNIIEARTGKLWWSFGGNVVSAALIAYVVWGRVGWAREWDMIEAQKKLAGEMLQAEQRLQLSEKKLALARKSLNFWRWLIAKVLGEI